MRALVTGANRGIGAALSQALTARGDSVIGTSRRGETDYALDVTDPASHAALASRLDGTALDLLVCNAGVYLDKGHRLGAGYGADLWARTFATNVTGVFLTIEHLLPCLKRGSAPRIMIISSTMASDTNAPGGSYIYRASKAAALNLGRNLAVDLKPEGIAVGIYHPGWVITDMGGAGADITDEEAARGLMHEADSLSLENTGAFRTWDGRDHPF